MNWAQFVAACVPSPDTITGEAYEGSGAFGDVYASPAAVTPCVVQAMRRRVRVQTQDAAGEEVLSETAVFCPPDTVLPPGSRVTLPDGRVTRVLVASTLNASGHDLPEHVELALE
ncbi:hypothetical protein ACFQZ4_24165 [Catellatospora coxensis]|uniref:Head-to-tail stopper n=1 Tax=Catellatospora coxensis TaxID=310354 RepID=A0A8J3KWD2_9ACTN|nr:hypothetical protein [Catellatospora coxensis]GIG10212.1 hypothetical protein Cco03nite_69120 [Catellatospora coxensis]